MENFSEKDLRNNLAVKWGLILASISLVLLFVSYFISKNYVFSPWNFLLAAIIWLTTLSVASVKLKRALGGFVSFGSAYLLMLFIILIAAFIYCIGEYILFNIMDTSLISLEKQISFDRAIEGMKAWGVPEKDIEEAAEKMEKEEYRSVGGYVRMYLYRVVGCGILALIIAGIVKRVPKNT